MEKCGYIDTRGRVAIPPQFDEVREFSEGRAAVRIGKKWGYLDTEGRVVVKPKYAEACAFADGVANVKVGGERGEGETWGHSACIDQNGRTVIPARRFLTAVDFSEGLAAIPSRINESGDPDDWGYINKRGNLVIAHVFHAAEPFSGGKALVLDSHGWAFVDTRGRVVSRLLGCHSLGGAFSEGLNIDASATGMAFIDTTGRTVIKPRFEDARDFIEGRAAVQVQRKWGFIDKSGRVIVQPRYRQVRDFSEGKAVVTVHTGHGDQLMDGYVDRLGQVFVKPTLWRAYSFHCGLALVQARGGKWYYIDKQGEPAIPSPPPDCSRWRNAYFLESTDGFSEGRAPFAALVPKTSGARGRM